MPPGAFGLAVVLVLHFPALDRHRELISLDGDHALSRSSSGCQYGPDPAAQGAPLSAVLDHDFGQHIPLIAPATNCLKQFIAWHRQNYDEEELHRDTTTMLEDAFLILQSVHELLHLHPANATVPGPSADTGGPDGDMIAALEPLLFAP